MIWIRRNHSYEVKVLCANGLSGEVCMRKQTFLYRFDPQEVSAGLTKTLELARTRKVFHQR